MEGGGVGVRVGKRVLVGVGKVVGVELGIELLLRGALAVSAGILQPAARLASASPINRDLNFINENITEGICNVNTHGQRKA